MSEHEYSDAQLARRAARFTDYGPEADAARARISRAYSRAISSVGISGRLPKTAAHELLCVVYRQVAVWRRKSIIRMVLRRLRQDSPVKIERASTDYLILMRAALPTVDPKKCSKWAAALDAADYHEIKPKRLSAFLDKIGGIEGAAKERARLWATVEEGAWAKRSPQRKHSMMIPRPNRRY